LTGNPISKFSSDFKHEICVFLEGIGECLVCFDILTPEDELDPDHSDSYEIDFSVFDEDDKHITYDITKKQYNHCENKANDERYGKRLGLGV
jgi:hypothetical protein